MVDSQVTDVPVKSQSSYLWTLHNHGKSPDGIKETPLMSASVTNGLQQAISPRFHQILGGSKTTVQAFERTKESTTLSLSKLHLNSNVSSQSRSVWETPSSLNDIRQIPVSKTHPSSKLTLINKSGQQLCEVRSFTLALTASLCLLCTIAIALPVGLVFGLRGSTTSTVSTTSGTTTPATAWIPSNYNTSCSNACVNVSTVTPSTLIASWTFEQNTNDVSGNGYDGHSVNGPVYTTGYIGQSILLQSNLSQYIIAPYINLVNRSFTVEAWIYLNSLATVRDLDIFGQCAVISTKDKCLHYVVRTNNLLMAFYNDDGTGTTNLTTSVWYHAAYVYDFSANVKYIYLNGVLDGTQTNSKAYQGLSGNVTLGSTAVYTSISYWNGLLDQITITNRAKTACEVLNDATLTSYFPFDNSYSDLGPNGMTATYNQQSNSGLSWVSGRVNQAISFSSPSSYVQSCGYWSLGQNQFYSIVMWIYPSSLGGTLVHLSSSSTGSGTWCFPLIGFSSNGSIVVQSLSGTAISILGPILPTNAWSHIVQTWSAINGIRFYLNGGLYNSAMASSFSSSLTPICILLGTSGLGTNCQAGLISMGAYSGAIDELYVYNRELNASEVCLLARP